MTIDIGSWCDLNTRYFLVNIVSTLVILILTYQLQQKNTLYWLQLLLFFIEENKMRCLKTIYIYICASVMSTTLNVYIYM